MKNVLFHRAMKFVRHIYVVKFQNEYSIKLRKNPLKNEVFILENFQRTIIYEEYSMHCLLFLQCNKQMLKF